MTATLPRTLALLCLACLANAARAEDQAAPGREDSAIPRAEPHRRWFSFPWKMRVNRRHDEQARKTQGPPPAVNGVILASILGGGLVLWLLLLTIRWRLRVGRAERQARETSALLGAMFGYPAGMWVYDKLYPCSPSGNEPEA
ncbi:MAG TPA: hypothetical protein VMF69_27560 [Gemmataceae bacterium]|nr:hypothetical protein [Gemmataceae bacterium]